MKQKFREMQTRMQDQMNTPSNFAEPAREKETMKKSKEDYIDFEEIK